MPESQGMERTRTTDVTQTQHRFIRRRRRVPKHTLTHPQKQDAGRAASRPPDATIGGPVHNEPRSQARAHGGPCSASSTTLSLEKNPRLSPDGGRKFTKTFQISGFSQDLYLATYPKICKIFPHRNPVGYFSLVELTSRSGLHSDCKSFHKLPGPSKRRGFGKIRVPLGCVRCL